ncbi:hypothetical protein GVAV_000434 [Gurleya vavrai]
MYKFIISTKQLAIPHIVDTNFSFLNHPLAIYVDDLFYKESFFINNKTTSLKEFINTTKSIFLIFKNDAFLQTIRGRLKISENEYKKLLETCKPDFYERYNSCKSKNIEHVIENSNDIIVEPENVFEMIDAIKNKKIITTNFINKLVDNGIFFTYKEDKIEIMEHYECEECCFDVFPGYIKHLKNEKEISAMTLIALHNYYNLDQFFKDINQNPKILCNLQIIE